MRIGIAGSMHFTEKLIEARDKLISLGHDAFTSGLTGPFIGKSDDEKERIKIHQKHTQDAMREFWDRSKVQMHC